MTTTPISSHQPPQEPGNDHASAPAPTSHWLRRHWNRRKGALIGAAAAMTALLGLAAAAPAAAWTDGELSWSACGFFDLGGPVRVQLDPGYPYPAASTSPEGATNSFTARIQGAVTEWNAVFANAPRYKHNVQIVKDVANPEVVVRNFNPNIGDGKDYLGYTWTQRRTDASSGSDFSIRCPYKSVVFRPTKYTRIETAKKDEWFTQDDTRRKYWEGGARNDYCPSNRGLNAPYATCSKLWDFEALMVHELGHALGQAHPNEPNSSGVVTTVAEDTAAKCIEGGRNSWEAHNEATMCKILSTRSSGQRSLEDWDIASFYRHTTIIP